MSLRRAMVIGLVLFSAVASAQSWPTRPVRFLVPFPPGGSTDVAARALAEKFSTALGQPVLVENRGGAGGAVGAAEVARAPADGHTILFAANAVSILHITMKKLSYDILTDFVPITQVTTQPNAIAVHASLPVRSIAELVAYAKAHPGKLAFAHAGTGGGHHLSGELLNKLAGISMVPIPYKGGAQAVQDLVGGQVPVAVLGSTPLIPHHKAGRIRILAFTSMERFAAIPEIPTLNESGFPGFDSTQWLGLLAPRGTDPAVVQRLHEETVKALALPDVRERLQGAALQPVGSTPAQFAGVIRTEVEYWSKLARELGIEPQ